MNSGVISLNSPWLPLHMCNPVIVPAHTRITRVEEIQAIQHIGSRDVETHTEEGALPPHLIDVLDAATELTPIQRARAATLLAKHVKTFPAPGTPITGRTEAVMHDIDTGSTRPIRCNPRKLSPKKIKIQQELVDKMLEEGQIEHSVSGVCRRTLNRRLRLPHILVYSSLPLCLLAYVTRQQHLSAS